MDFVDSETKRFNKYNIPKQPSYQALWINIKMNGYTAMFLYTFLQWETTVIAILLL